MTLCNKLCLHQNETITLTFIDLVYEDLEEGDGLIAHVGQELRLDVGGECVDDRERSSLWSS